MCQVIVMDLFSVFSDLTSINKNKYFTLIALTSLLFSKHSPRCVFKLIPLSLKAAEDSQRTSINKSRSVVKVRRSLKTEVVKYFSELWTSHTGLFTGSITETWSSTSADKPGEENINQKMNRNRNM